MKIKYTCYKCNSSLILDPSDVKKKIFLKKDEIITIDEYHFGNNRQKSTYKNNSNIKENCIICPICKSICPVLYNGENNKIDLYVFYKYPENFSEVNKYKCQQECCTRGSY